jgi:hypothetical protein
MKNTFKVLGIIALVAVIGFSFVSCDPDGGNTSGADVIGATLRLYNKAVTGASSGNHAFYYSGGASPLSGAIDGTPKVLIAGSKLTIELDAVKPGALDTAANTFFTGITSSPADARFFWIDEFPNSDETKDLGCYDTGSKQLGLVYASKDATVSGTYTYSGTTYNMTSGVSVKQGWNLIISTFNSGTNTFTYTSTRTYPSGFGWMVY